MRALVTNDDGIAAPGLRRLAMAAEEAGLDVVVAAPEQEASGASAALAAVYRDGRLPIMEVALDGVIGPAYHISASPSYIVILAALGAFGPPPELVLSGINLGANAGHAVLHSGTVGAAFTAVNHGLRAMAVSLDVSGPVTADPARGGAALSTEPDRVHLHWTTAARVTRDLLPTVDSSAVLNVNVPNRPFEELAGTRRTSLAPFGQVRMALAERGEGYVRVTVEASGQRRAAGTDVQALADGYVSVTSIGPLRATF
jgi:5'-nucleotidase